MFRAGAEPLESRVLLSFDTVDVNVRPAPTLAGMSALDGVVYFAHDDGVHGIEPWRSDGTPAGTALVRDVRPGPAGSEPDDFCAVGYFVYFVVDDGAGNQQLWRTAGTAESTGLVRQFDAAAGGVNLSNLVDVNGTAFFAVDGFERRVLWKTDGTAAGTVPLREIPHIGYAPQAPSELYGLGVGDVLYFRGYTGNREDRELWRSDGTPEGTGQVADLYSAGDVYWPDDFAPLGDRMVFTHQYFSDDLWVTDGTADGTTVVKDFGFSVGGLRDLTPFGGRVYFRIRRHGPIAASAEARVGPSSPIPPSYSELWSTDGTEAGTRLVTPTADGQQDFFDGEMEVSGGALYYTAQNGTELWRIAAPDAPPQQVPVPRLSTFGPPIGHLADLNGVLYFFDTDWDGKPLLRRAVGTAVSAVPFTERPTGLPGHAITMIPSGERLFVDLWLEQDPNVHPYDTREVWSVSNAAAQLTRAAALVSGTLQSWPRGPKAAGGRLYFDAQDRTGLQSPDLWTADGTTTDTHKLLNLGGVIGRGPATMGAVGDVMLFTVHNDRTYEDHLWRSDGTAQGTYAVVPASVGRPVDVNGSWALVSGRLYFTSDTGGVAGLWSSDGTPGGTLLVKSLAPGPVPYPLVAAGNTLYFFQADLLNGTNGRLWRSDGTGAGTVPVKTVGNASEFYTAGDRLIFTVRNYPDPAVTWWSDGTEAGTGPVPAALLGQYGAAGGMLFLRRVTQEGRPRLYRTDGTEAGTVLLREFDAVPAKYAFPQGQMFDVGGRLLFVAPDAQRGWELWSSDGTADGTKMVADIAPGRWGSFPLGLVADGDVLIFSADDLTHGRELWRTDGTAAGTWMVEDIQPGRRGSDPYEAAWAGQTLFVTATTTAHGMEVRVVHGDVAGRQVFYAGSGPGGSAGGETDVAADKRALLPGQRASFANLTSYVKGLTGLLIDVRSARGLRADLGPSDFLFRAGTGGDPSTWAPAPAPSGVQVVKGGGAAGADRVVLTWPDGALRNTWLQVTGPAGARTGLDRPDVFYFGNLVGETGNGRARVDVLDVAQARANVGSRQPAAVARFDFDRNGRIDLVDVFIARSNVRRTLSLLDAPAAAIAAAPRPLRRAAPRRSVLADAGVA